jgi:hypothetical protein
MGIFSSEVGDLMFDDARIDAVAAWFEAFVSDFGN